jgi:hypothetical protein
VRLGLAPQAIAVAALLLLPAPVRAQGLGDAAAREKKKRAQAGDAAPKKVFTDADLPQSSSATAPAADGEAADAAHEKQKPAAGQKAAPAGDEAEKDPLEAERRERQRLEAEWRVRFAEARERLARADAAAWREVVRTEFYQGIPVQMKVREKIETPELVAARQAMADLEEEFRRTGLPPGWARER